MATSGSWEVSWQSGYWANDWNYKWYHWAGNWEKSGNTIHTFNQRIWMTFVSDSSWGDGPTDDLATTGAAWQTIEWHFSGNPSSTIYINDGWYNVGSRDTSSVINMWISGENTGSVTIYFDPTVSDPTGLALANIKYLENGFTGTVSVSGWGNGGSTSGSYLEMSVCSASGDLNNRVWNAHYGRDTSWDITTTNTSYSTKKINIQSNTNYYLTMYATNGDASTGNSSFYEYTTLASPPIANNFVMNGSGPKYTLTFDITEASGGTHRSVHCEYRYKLSSSSTWSDWVEAGEGNQETFNVSIEDVEAGSYDFETRAWWWKNSESKAYYSSTNSYPDAISYTNAITITEYSIGHSVSNVLAPITANLVFSGALEETDVYHITLSVLDGNGNVQGSSIKDVDAGEGSTQVTVNCPTSSSSQDWTLLASMTISDGTTVTQSAPISFTVPSNQAVPPLLSYSWSDTRMNLLVTTSPQDQSSILVATTYSTTIYSVDADGVKTLLYNWTGTAEGTESRAINLDPKVYPNLVVESIQYVQYGTTSSVSSTSIPTKYVIRGKIMESSGNSFNIVRVKIKDKNGDMHDGDYQHPFVIK